MPEAALRSGDALAHYRIVGLIGAGGMGEVYPAEDDRLRRKVALKLRPPALATDPQRVRRFESQASDRRLRLIIESSLHNARCLDQIAATLHDDAELQGLLRWQLVDGALSIFHKLRQFHSAKARRECQRRLRRERLHGLLWRNAADLRQKRRIARNYLKALAAL